MSEINLKEVTINDFAFTGECKIETYGSYQPVEYAQKVESAINISSIGSAMVKLAAITCNFYASDVFHEWNAICKMIYEFGYDSCILSKSVHVTKRKLFGFYESGIANEKTILPIVNSSNEKEEILSNYKELYMIEIDWHDGQIKVTFGCAEVIY